MVLNDFIFSTLLLAIIYIYCPEEFDPNLKPRDVPQDELEEEYDFIVVGAGTAGCVVASRLSENPAWTVLLIEAGGDETPLSDVPFLFYSLWNTDFDWNYTTIPQRKACLSSEGICPYHSGHVMGGSSAIALMVYSRGSRKDFDDWAKLGNEGWSSNDVWPYIIKTENGPLNIQNLEYQTPLSEDFIEAGKEFGLKHRDSNVWPDNSIDNVKVNMIGSSRQSTSKAYLEPIRNRTNLAIIKRSLVTKILFDNSGTFAIGVEFIRNGEIHIVRTRKEVIVSCGAINTPKLLMLSGIGPEKELQKEGIQVISDLPVGRHLQDHFGPTITFEINENVTLTGDVWATRSAILEYAKYRRGPLTSMGFEALAFINPDHKSAPSNIGLLFASLHWLNPIINKPVISVAVNFMYPKSSGSIKLKSCDPFDPPFIDPNYYSEKSDFNTVRKGVENLFKFMETDTMRKYSPCLLIEDEPNCQGLDVKRYIECTIKEYSLSQYTYSGTAKMGPEDDFDAVVSPNLIVRGFNNLRVVDASVMPITVRGGTVGTVIMIAEKASDMIKIDHGTV